MNSLRRLQKIGERPRLARFVQTLVCHSFGLGTYLTNQDTHRRSVEPHFILLSLGAADQGPPRQWLFEDRLYLRLYSAYMDELAAQSDYERCDHIGAAFQKTFAPSGQLCGLVWGDIERDVDDRGLLLELSDKDALFHHTGVKNLVWAEIKLLDICSALQSFCLTTVIVVGVDLGELQSEKVELPSIFSILTSARTLHLKFNLHGLGRLKTDQRILDQLTCSLKQAQLRILRIGFDWLPWDGVPDYSQEVSTAFPAWAISRP